MGDETITTPGGTPGDTTNKSTNTPGVTDTTKTDPGAGEGALDTSKWTDADWAKVYSDPKLYNHPRFKQLNERATLAKTLEEEKKAAEEKRLTEEKNFQELAKRKEEEANTWKGKAETAFVNNAIAIAAQKAGVVDLEAVTKLIDRKDIKLGDDGTVTGVEEAVKALVESKPYLKGGKPKNTTTIGGDTNPGSDDTTTPRFKLSQLQDRTFYKAHEKEIDQAFRLGLIENDMFKHA